jgi:hypothetical protein
MWGVDAMAGMMPDVSPMAYALNNPISLNDPTGLYADGGGATCTNCTDDNSHGASPQAQERPDSETNSHKIPTPPPHHKSYNYNNSFSLSSQFDMLKSNAGSSNQIVPNSINPNGQLNTSGALQGGTIHPNNLPIIPEPSLPELPIILPPDLLFPPIRNPKKEKPLPYWHVTYTKYNPATDETYVGRSHGYGLTPEQVVRERDKYHHKWKEGFGEAFLDRSAQGFHGYLAIRGREQIMIDAFGGAWSDVKGGRGHTKSGNNIRGVASYNPFAPAYYFFAKLFFP